MDTNTLLLALGLPTVIAFIAKLWLRSETHEKDIQELGKKVEEVKETEKKDFEDIDTVTMYISDKFQKEYYEYVVSLNPRRVIFNPGTENPEFEELLIQNDIHVEEACTLVLLGSGQY